MSQKTMSVSQEGPANALALNRENNQVVIAGRNVFKVFTIEEEEFVESYNLRVGKNQNLNFSCNDVAWNTLEDQTLATAATNGAVVLWNLDKPSRSKQQHVFLDHKRTVNKVSFHPTEAHWLISGSQDGTMKCFDIRMRDATKTFMSNTESIRDVQFSPQLLHAFAAVSENGNVQLWDVRRPDKCTHQFTAHSGPVFACDWHPECNWLATASRDKTIKVWELSTGRPLLEYTISTIASVGRIKWRPQRKHHIASCALVVDCSINVWDIRRPYIPFASFQEHKDVATGLAWRGDPQVFLSVSRDCTLIHHVFKDATRPADQANPQGISINSSGDVAFACRISSSNVPFSSKIQGYLRKSHLTSEQFCQATSSMHLYSMKAVRENRWMVESARRYILNGRSLAEMCDHNAAVARELGRHQVSLVWSIIKTLYWSSRGGPGDPNPPSASAVTGRDDSSVSGEVTAATGTNTTAGEPEQRVVRSSNNTNGEVAVTGSGNVDGGDAIATEEETETDETTEISLNGVHLGLPSFAKTPMTQGDFFFGDGEMDPLDMDSGMGVGASVGVGGGLLAALALGMGNGGSQIGTVGGPADEWMLSSEAFPLRHEILDRSPPPETYPNHLEPSEQETQTVAVEEQPAPLLNVSALSAPLMWDCGNVVADALRHHASMGDVQMAASALLVLGDKRRGLGVDEATQEHWMLGYIDFLGRHELYNVATQVIKLSWLPNVNQLSQQSTTYYTCCGQCEKPLHRTGWLCDRCHSSESSLCSVCHQVVKGLYAWCQGCAHGGHIHHIQQWLSTNKYCPSGCGHLCEYN
ncbi:GATOR complex protein WDR24 [Thrips palmi]|uniref:GATOR2 complex protein WDR24 n=1 Tax=Thrips palmi TaxID=161013 RepID=A0A6P8ZAB1_THRPL|nr:GATOR complex protein WDR24 [Thrips palmi]